MVEPVPHHRLHQAASHPRWSASPSFAPGTAGRAQRPTVSPPCSSSRLRPSPALPADCCGARPRPGYPSAAPPGTRPHASPPAASAPCCSRNAGTRRRLQPGHRPLRPTTGPPIVPHGQFRLPAQIRHRHRRVAHILGQAVPQPARKMQHGLRRHVGRARDRRVTTPADGDPTEQVGLGPAKLEQPRRLNSSGPKMAGSGLNRIVVPRRFCTGPAFSSFAVGLPCA